MTAVRRGLALRFALTALAAVLAIWPQAAAAQSAPPTGDAGNPSSTQSPTEPPGATPTPGAWWSALSVPDDVDACAIETAWDQAAEAELTAEGDLSTDRLQSVLDGAELQREQQVVAALATRGQVLDVEEVRQWQLVGASTDQAIVFATSTRLGGCSDADASQLTGATWVERTQTAYRLVHVPDGWKVTDQHVFELRRHAADLSALSAFSSQYRRLLTDAVGAFATGDYDNLDQVLTGAALDGYRQSVQSAADANSLERVALDGSFVVVDASADTALAAFSGTATVRAIDPATGALGAPTEHPFTTLNRLERDNGEWKIAYQLAQGSHTDADGTTHLDGC